MAESTAEHVLITGGAGFIGTRLARRLLDRGCAVRILDILHPQVHGSNPVLAPWIRQECGLRVGDVQDPAAVDAAVRDVDAVIHLAAETGTGQSMYAVRRYVDVNIGGTATLLEALAPLRNRVRKVLIASSRAVYGEGKYHCRTCGVVYPEPRTPEALASGQWELPCPRCGGTIQTVATDEDSQPRPASVYGTTKLTQELLGSAFGRSFSVPVSVLRYQNVYGAGQSLSNPYTGILTHFFAAIRRGEAPRVFEDGLESRDFVHVEDVVSASMKALDDPESAVFNVGSGARTTILDLAGHMSRLGRGVEPIVVGEYRVGDIRHSVADLTRVQDRLGYRPQIALDAGLREFMDWADRQPLPSARVDHANHELATHGLLKSRGT